MKCNSKKEKMINILLLLFIFICLIIMAYAGTNIYLWYKDAKSTEEITNKILDNVEIETSLEEDVQIIEQDVKEDNIYWRYLKMNLIDVNFTDLKNLNNDTVGWLQVNGTNVNYPFVQSNDNNYYLKHSYDKSFNYAGWLFLDYRNSIDSFDRNMIIYGHSRVDKTMFGSLSNVLTKDWYNNKDNHVIKISTEKYNSLWQIFSIYHLPKTSDYLKTDFETDDEFNEFISMLKNRSIYNFDTVLNENDRILTLSTCHNNTAKNRLVVHAKLVKYVEKNNMSNE